MDLELILTRSLRNEAFTTSLVVGAFLFPNNFQAKFQKAGSLRPLFICSHNNKLVEYFEVYLAIYFTKKIILPKQSELPLKKKAIPQSRTTILKEYKLAIIDSLILSFSGFLENVIIDDYKDEIEYVKEEREYYRKEVHQFYINKYIVQSYEYYEKHDGSFPVQALCIGYAQALKDRSFLRTQREIFKNQKRRSQ